MAKNYVFLLRLCSVLFFNFQPKDLVEPSHLLLEGHTTIVEGDGVVGLTQGADGAGLVEVVALEDILHDLNATALYGDYRLSKQMEGVFEDHPYSSVIRSFFAVMDSHFYGATMHESCSNLLRLFGVKAEELDAFREIMLEPAE